LRATGGAPGSARKLLAAAAACLAVIALGVELAPGATSPARGDPNDAEGPLDLSRARLHQEKRNVLLTLRFHGARPPLRELSRFPPRVGADDRRYLCLQLEGRRIGRRLLCPGGRTSEGGVSVGVSGYGRSGAATRRGQVRAGIKRHGRTGLELRFALADLEPGRLRWAILGGWTGKECTPPPSRVVEGGKRPARGRPARSKRRWQRRQRNLCLDREPDAGFAKARLFELRRVGCTRASPVVHRSGSGHGRRIALTFDDGPSSFTESVVRILDHEGAKGTFFEVGTEVPGKSAVMREALRHGHELGNHSLRHESFPGYSSMRETSSRIEAATGFRPCAFRPPGGAFNSGVVSAAARNAMSTVLWDVDPRDWSRPGPSAIYSRVVGGAHPGAIILMHDGGGDRSETVAALPRIINTLKSRGYHLVTVTEILGERFIFEEDR
jgi:peptidoglycan/xylan/chitin deacetylase (PgdA/CDA1 family)